MIKQEFDLEKWSKSPYCADEIINYHREKGRLEGFKKSKEVLLAEVLAEFKDQWGGEGHNPEYLLKQIITKMQGRGGGSVL